MRPLWFWFLTLLCHHQAFDQALFVAQAGKSSDFLVPTSQGHCYFEQIRPAPFEVDSQPTSFARRALFEEDHNSNGESTVAVRPLQEDRKGFRQQLQPLWGELGRCQSQLRPTDSWPVKEATSSTTRRMGKQQLGLYQQLWYASKRISQRLIVEATTQITTKRPLSSWTEKQASWSSISQPTRQGEEPGALWSRWLYCYAQYGQGAPTRTPMETLFAKHACAAPITTTNQPTSRFTGCANPQQVDSCDQEEARPVRCGGPCHSTGSCYGGGAQCERSDAQSCGRFGHRTRGHRCCKNGPLPESCTLERLFDFSRSSLFNMCVRRAVPTDQALPAFEQIEGMEEHFADLTLMQLSSRRVPTSQPNPVSAGLNIR